MDSADLGVILAEHAASLPSEDRDSLEGQIRTAYARHRGELDEEPDPEE